jgi:hypothetical protein
MRCVSFRLGELHLLPHSPHAPCCCKPTPRQAALFGPSPIEKLSLCRIFPEGLRSSIGLLSRVWRVACFLGGCFGLFGVPFFFPFFLQGCSRCLRFSICET